MKICRITRPPLEEFSTKFPQREYYVLSRLERRGHKIIQHKLHPVKIPNKYLSFGIGFLLSVIKFRKVKADVIIADNIESATAAIIIRIFFSIPFVFDFIDDYSLIARYDAFKLRYYLIGFFEKLLPRFADLIIVVDEHKRQFCMKIGIKKEKIILIPNGADTEKFNPDIFSDEIIKNFALENCKIVLFIGKLNRYYRIETMIEAAPFVLKKFPDARFVLIGNGDNLRGLRRLCRRLKVDHAVLFTGFRPPEEIPRFIACADVCVFPLPDSSALAIYEYMACGKPTIVSDCSTEKMGVSGDIIPDDCILKTTNSPQGFAEGINLLLEDRELRDQIGKKARQFVETSYNWDELASRYESALALVC